MAWYATFDGVDGTLHAGDGASNTLMVGETYRPDGGEASGGHRLFVGNLTVDSFDFVSEAEDEVLVGLEHATLDTDHPDFLWSPTLL